jgi:hypothetical protein
MKTYDQANTENLCDARDVTINYDDKVLLTNSDNVRIGKVVGFRKTVKSPNWNQGYPAVIVKTEVNKHPVYIQSYRWTLVCIEQLAKDVL